MFERTNLVRMKEDNLLRRFFSRLQIIISLCGSRMLYVTWKQRNKSPLNRYCRPGAHPYGWRNNSAIVSQENEATDKLWLEFWFFARQIGLGVTCHLLRTLSKGFSRASSNCFLISDYAVKMCITGWRLWSVWSTFTSCLKRQAIC